MEARRVLGQLRAKQVQSDELDVLEAWLSMETLKHSEAGIVHAPDHPSSWDRYYEANWRIKRERESVIVLQEGVRLHPNNIDLRRKIVSMYAAAGAYEPALAHCDAALRIDPTVPDLLQLRARIAVISESDQATAAIEALIQHCPEQWLEAHRHCLRIGNPVWAEHVLEGAMEAFPEHLGPRVGLARIGLWKGDVGVAAAAINRCQQRHEHQAEGLALQGMVQYLRGDPKAGESLHQANELGLPVDSPIEASELACWLANDAFENKMWAESVRFCDAAISSSTRGHPFAYLLRVVAACQGMPMFDNQSVSSRWFFHVEQFEPLTGPLPPAWKRKYDAFFSTFRTIQSKLFRKFYF